MSKRRLRSPAERAQEVVDVLERRLARIQTSLARKTEELSALEKELDLLDARLRYALDNPDLPDDTPGPK